MRDRFDDWILVTGNRYAVAGGVLALAIGILIVPFLSLFEIRNTTPLYYVASGLIAGNITLVTVVVAINQVVLSQELESPGSLRDEIEETADYRQTALDRSISPTEPSEFLRRLVQQTRRRALSLEELLPESVETADDRNGRLVTDLPAHCERVTDRLERGDDELSTVIAPILGASYADYIHACHSLRTRYEEAGHERLHATFDHLTSNLEDLDVARQYFTTTFIKEELAILSRSLLYVSVLSVSMPIALLLWLTAFDGSFVPELELFAFTLLTGAIGLTPLALLIAFVLRIATVAQRIAAITPFEA